MPCRAATYGLGGPPGLIWRQPGARRLLVQQVVNPGDSALLVDKHPPFLLPQGLEEADHPQAFLCVEPDGVVGRAASRDTPQVLELGGLEAGHEVRHAIPPRWVRRTPGQFADGGRFRRGP